MAEKLLYTRADAANSLSISVRTLDTLQARKEIRVVRVGRKVLIPASEVAKFARRDHAGRKATPIKGPSGNE